MRKTCFVLVIAILFSMLFNIASFANNRTEIFNPSDSIQFSEDRIIVVLDNQTSLNFKNYTPSDFYSVGCKRVDELSKNVDKKIKRALDNGARHVLYGESLEEYNGIAIDNYNQILCIELNEAGRENVIDAINALNSMDGVLAASPDYVMELMTSPNDQYFSDQKAGTIDYFDKIDLYDAWDITTGSSTVRVGVIDSGIDRTHPDLNINTSLSKDYSTGIETSGTVDSLGHGTSVAGVIGAMGNNTVGISGVCWNVELVSLKIFQFSQFTYSSYAMNAIDYAASDDANIDILNISACWRGDETTEPIYYDRVFNASISNFDGLVVCAAGNSEADEQCLDVIPRYPAAYNCSNIIAVGASTRYDTKYTTSNYSTTYVDLFAPGDGILTTFATNVCDDPTRHQFVQIDHYEDGYHRMCETSIATPFVTGVAALMLSINPNLTAVQLKDIITRTVDIVPALENYCVSGGRLNAYKAVRTAQMYRFAMDSTYEQLSTSDTLYTKAHGVWYDNCECSCRNADLSCDSGLCEYACDPCEDCHYYFTELHDFSHIATTNLNTHNVVCLDCGYSGTFIHYWIDNGTTYTCYYCNMNTTSPPILSVLSSTDPELEAYLASLSDEELEEFIASLPEDQVDRVTALLPSDDEHLTE